MTRVLVVDDQEVIREIVADLLASNGHAVDTAANGSDALEVIHRSRPDAVLIDMLMPELGAWDFLTRYSADSACRGLPVVALGSADSVGPALPDAGISAVIPNPFDLNDLLDRIEEVVSNPSGRSHVQDRELVAAY
jgi:CheY-like chemotaxis protein